VHTCMHTQVYFSESNTGFYPYLLCNPLFRKTGVSDPLTEMCVCLLNAAAKTAVYSFSEQKWFFRQFYKTQHIEIIYINCVTHTRHLHNPQFETYCLRIPTV